MSPTMGSSGLVRQSAQQQTPKLSDIESAFDAYWEGKDYTKKEVDINPLSAGHTTGKTICRKMVRLLLQPCCGKHGKENKVQNHNKLLLEFQMKIPLTGLI